MFQAKQKPNFFYFFQNGCQYFERPTRNDEKHFLVLRVRAKLNSFFNMILVIADEHPSLQMVKVILKLSLFRS